MKYILFFFNSFFFLFFIGFLVHFLFFYRQISIAVGSPLKKRRLEPAFLGTERQQTHSQCDSSAKGTVTEINHVTSVQKKAAVSQWPLVKQTPDRKEKPSIIHNTVQKNISPRESLSSYQNPMSSKTNMKLETSPRISYDESAIVELKNVTEGYTSQRLTPTKRKGSQSQVGESQTSPRDDENSQQTQHVTVPSTPISSNNKSESGSCNNMTGERNSYQLVQNHRRLHTDSDALSFNKENVPTLIENSGYSNSNNTFIVNQPQQRSSVELMRTNKTSTASGRKELKKTSRTTQLPSPRIFSSQNGTLQQVLHWVLFDFQGSFIDFTTLKTFVLVIDVCSIILDVLLLLLLLLLFRLKV